MLTSVLKKKNLIKLKKTWAYLLKFSVEFREF